MIDVRQVFLLLLANWSPSSLLAKTQLWDAVVKKTPNKRYKKHLFWKLKALPWFIFSVHRYYLYLKCLHFLKLVFTVREVKSTRTVGNNSSVWNWKIPHQEAYLLINPIITATGPSWGLHLGQQHHISKEDMNALIQYSVTFSADHWWAVWFCNKPRTSLNSNRQSRSFVAKKFPLKRAN